MFVSFESAAFLADKAEILHLSGFSLSALLPLEHWNTGFQTGDGSDTKCLSTPLREYERVCDLCRVHG